MVNNMAAKKIPLQHDSATNKHEIREGQSIELLKELHILTRDGKMNQDSRRKLKQVYHLYQFIEPLLNDSKTRDRITLVDHGAGKSYLGFILYDLYFKNLNNNSHIYGIETRTELVNKSELLACNLGFTNMSFLNLSVAESIATKALPAQINIVTALHACNTATDDAIDFALAKEADYIVLVPCCQAEVASYLRSRQATDINHAELHELWRHPIHGREFGSHLTNVLRCLRLEAHGYKVTTTELIGWEHSMKNELIIAKRKNQRNEKAEANLKKLLDDFGLTELERRFQI